jgi:hypothetical protein
MEVSEALVLLSDGHSVLTEEAARAVCGVLGVAYPTELVISWQGAADAFGRYGFLPYDDVPGSGVEGLDLSYHVARSLGLGAPGSGFTGRGFQAQANARAIEAHITSISK